jgi:hypothetical protein
VQQWLQNVVPFQLTQLKLDYRSKRLLLAKFQDTAGFMEPCRRSLLRRALWHCLMAWHLASKDSLSLLVWELDFTSLLEIFYVVQWLPDKTQQSCKRLQQGLPQEQLESQLQTRLMLLKSECKLKASCQKIKDLTRDQLTATQRSLQRMELKAYGLDGVPTLWETLSSMLLR